MDKSDRLGSCYICVKPVALMFDYLKHQYFGCKKCGHVVTLPYPTEEVIAHHYIGEMFVVGKRR